MIRIVSMIICLATVCALALVPGTVAAKEKSAAPYFAGWKLPDRITLCGERVPLKNRRVRETLDQQFIIAAGNEHRVKVWLRRAGRYFPHIEKRLAQMGLPSDLKYAAVSRTFLTPDYRSKYGPAGMWLLTEPAAKRYGLRVDKEMDERLNFELSTEAALKHFQALHQFFGQWALALAAFNGGEGFIAKAMEEQAVNDFYRLHVPLGLEQQVLRLAAVKTLMENPARYGVAADPRHAYLPLETDRVQVDLAAPVRITKAAKALALDYKTLKELNPQFLGDHLPKGRYTMWVPAGMKKKMNAFLKRNQ